MPLVSLTEAHGRKCSFDHNDELTSERNEIFFLMVVLIAGFMVGRELREYFQPLWVDLSHNLTHGGKFYLQNSISSSTLSIAWTDINNFVLYYLNGSLTIIILRVCILLALTIGTLKLIRNILDWDDEENESFKHYMSQSSVHIYQRDQYDNYTLNTTTECK